MGDLIAVAFSLAVVMLLVKYGIARWSDTWPNNRR